MELWLQAATALLAAYGGYALVRGVRFRRIARSAARTPVTLVAVVKDQDDRVEGWANELLDLRRALAGRMELDLVIVDDRSADQTGPILERLSRGAAGLHVVRMERVFPASASPVEAARMLSRAPVSVVVDLRRPDALDALRALLAPVSEPVMRQESCART